MSLGEIIGYIASALVLLTFCMRTMIPLRMAAIASNVAFITYGALGGIYPVLILHVILLPLNAYRTIEMYRLVRRVGAAARGDLSVDWLKPFMKSQRCAGGTRLFRKGDRADCLYYIVAGDVLLEEIGRQIGPGTLLGEIGLFSPDHQRTQSARCLSDAEVLWLDERELAQLCYQNPAMAFHLLRLITRRLSQDVARLQPANTP